MNEASKVSKHREATKKVRPAIPIYSSYLEVNVIAKAADINTKLNCNCFQEGALSLLLQMKLKSQVISHGSGIGVRFQDPLTRRHTGTQVGSSSWMIGRNRILSPMCLSLRRCASARG